MFGKRCACAEIEEKAQCFKDGNAKRCRSYGKRKRDSHAAAQRRSVRLSLRRCAAAEKSSSVTFI
jgi:hypothetical protein